MKPRTTTAYHEAGHVVDLPLASIRLDFQPRDNLIEETVQKYMALLRQGEKLPPLEVRFDGKHYFLADGFHRLEAARRMGLKTIAVEIRRGTLAEMETEYKEYLVRLRADLAKGAAKKK